MMEIQGMIYFRIILPHVPGCRSLFAATPLTARTAPTLATAFSAGARMGPACGAG